MNVFDLKHMEDQFRLIICDKENHDNYSVHEFNSKLNTKKVEKIK